MAILAFILFVILLGMLIFSCLFWLGVWASVSTLIRGEDRRHAARAADTGPWPSVSILKPLKGRDPQAVQNFSSFCQQDYPGPVEMLFGIAREDDLAVGAVRELQAACPGTRVSLHVAPPLGANPKTALLHHLQQRATGEILVISDSDVCVSRQYLRAVVQPLRDLPHIGVVTCPYRVEHARGLAARLESLGRAGFLVPAAIFASTVLAEPLGLGATIAVRHADLLRSGGFAAMADHLADDNQLARQIHKLGLGIYMSGHVVSIVSDGWCRSLAGLWRREIRWARAERVACGTLKYLGMTLTFTLTLALGTSLFDIWRTGDCPNWLAALCIGAACLRLTVAGRCSALLGYPMDFFDYLLVIPRALWAPLLWMLSLVGRQVTWRGQRFVLHRDGRLALPAPAAPNAGWLNKLTRRIDAHLRRQQGIRNFSHDPSCIFRISQAAAPYSLTLDDNTALAAGEPVVELHFWSEHLPRIAPGGPTFGWARQTMAAAESSLAELARAFEDDPSLRQIRAIHGSASFLARNGQPQLERMLHRLGFEIHPDPRPLTLGRRLHDAGENILIWMLSRAYNPGSLASKPALWRPRQQVWMSRSNLLQHHGQLRSSACKTNPAGSGTLAVTSH